MFAASKQPLARLTALRVGARRVPRHVRLQSTIPGTSQSAGSSPFNSHMAAGVAGGGVVLLGAYAWYHFSGVKRTVQIATFTQNYIRDTTNQVATTVSESAKNPVQSLQKLREVAHSYVVLIPGAGGYIDTAFDHLDQIAETHRDEAERIANSAYEEIRGIIKKKGGPKKMDAAATYEVMQVLSQKMNELYQLGKKAGGDLVQPILDNHPEVKEKIGAGYDQLKQLAETHGPEAKKILDDTAKQLKGIFSRGFSADAVSQASNLIQSKASEIKDMAEPAAKDAWNKAIEKANPYLEKMPEIRDTLNQNASKFTGAGLAYLSGAGASEMWQKVKEASQGDKKKQGELKKYIEQTAKEAEGAGERGLGNILDYIKAFPGGKEMLDKTPNISTLIEVSQSRGDDAKKLVQETYEDILRVLDDKAKKAKDLGIAAKEDAKRGA